MTLHVNYDHKCSECGALYIPYHAEIHCPKCGVIEEEYFDYIAKAAASLCFNRREGSYTPAAWYVGSLGDHILGILFRLFDAFEEASSADFGSFAVEYLARMDWGDQTYLQMHVYEISRELHNVLKEDAEGSQPLGL